MQVTCGGAPLVHGNSHLQAKGRREKDESQRRDAAARPATSTRTAGTWLS
jgi:hypothetical protein